MKTSFLTVSLALLASLTGCGGAELPPITLAVNGMSAESGGLGVSGGGYRVATGEPVLFYGTLLENGRRDYSYLIIAKGLEPGGGEFEQSWSGISLAESDRLSTQHSLAVDGFPLSAEFVAEVRDGAVAGKSLTVCGEPVPNGEWLFLVDATRPGAKPEAYSSPRPELPLDFELLGGFTLDYVFCDLAVFNSDVKAFLAQ